jgi:hypothetical protein
LLSKGKDYLPVQRVTALLTRCLTRLSPLMEVNREAVASLTVGDREALLLQLRRLMTGDRMPCIVTCPNAGCGEKMDLDLSIKDLLLPPYNHAQANYRKNCTVNGSSFEFHFRLPTGADQEAVAELGYNAPMGAVKSLMRRCIIRSNPNCQKAENELPDQVFSELSGYMADLDPQAELALNLKCPYCRKAFSTVLDMTTFFFEEMAGRNQSLYREVHLLALHYHWSEADILAMTADKRRRYLELLSETRSRATG